jgi:glyceraldehyde-3-phosphate dehydrogenase (ferredoxin)
MRIDLSNQKWGVACPTDQNLTGPVQYGWDRFQKDPHSITLGGGLLAGSPLPGTRRMIFCGYSPSWQGFYVSSLGGAMYVFHRLGVNYLWLQGQSQQDVVLVINHKGGEYSLRFEPLEPEKYWEGYTDEKGREWIGYYGLQRFLFEKYRSEFDGDAFRILTVGPSARHTLEGAIGSNPIRKGDISVVDDWAGRGGLGSRLLQYHHVAGIVFGGDWQDPALKEAKELDEYFIEHFGQRAMTSDIILSQKYRYVPKFDTGGTFGVNMHETEDRLFSFNYQSIYVSDDRRLEQHDNFILQHYLKQFNEETIAPRNFDHCGEPCAVVCKKFVGEFKKDYEPYEALGPNCGIFDQRAAEKINKFVDSMGWDAIQAGGTVAWIMELVAEGLIPPADFDLPEDKPHFTFVSKPEEFDVVKDSEHNANYAIEIVKMILFKPAGEPFRKGMRQASLWLDEKYHINSRDKAVYNAHGESGLMVPNQYWVPGMFAPMPLMGKYFSYYNVDFIPPYEMGKKHVERFVYELYSENSGSCRFHRRWVEDIIDEIIASHFDLNMDYWQLNFDLAKAIADFQIGQSVFWESQRVVDIMQGYLEKWQRDGLKKPALDEWIERFHQDPKQAAKDYWQAMYNGIVDTFAKGLEEPLHVEHGFIKKD